MRNFLTMISITLATQAAGIDRSGMFVCTPKSDNETPIIYAFDGVHLLRDNNLETPFTKLASLSDQLDLYFAFTPSLSGKRKLEAAKMLEKFPELVVAEAEGFLANCEFSGKSTYTEYANKVMASKDRYEKLAQDGAPLLPYHSKCGQTVEQILNFNLTPDDLNHVKLTINFANMTVVEEVVYPEPTSLDLFSRKVQSRLPIQQTFACKSLIVEVPKVDTSKSIVPLAKDTL